jgi:hypothetical protein
MRELVTISHWCAIRCPKCYGSGEAWYDAPNCTQCKGEGTLWDKGEVTDEFEVEWYLKDFSDLVIIDGYKECDRCGQDMMEIIIEGLSYLQDQTKLLGGTDEIHD